MPAPSYSHGISDVPLLGETIGANLERTVARFGDREAVVSCHQGVRLTYSELDEAVDRLASGLIAAGGAEGGPGGILGPDSGGGGGVAVSPPEGGGGLLNNNPPPPAPEGADAI